MLMMVLTYDTILSRKIISVQLMLTDIYLYIITTARKRDFKESETSFIEISAEEYKDRQRLHENRIKTEGETGL